MLDNTTQLVCARLVTLSIRFVLPTAPKMFNCGLAPSMMTFVMQGWPLAVVVQFIAKKRINRTAAKQAHLDTTTVSRRLLHRSAVVSTAAISVRSSAQDLTCDIASHNLAATGTVALRVAVSGCASAKPDGRGFFESFI